MKGELYLLAKYQMEYRGLSYIHIPAEEEVKPASGNEVEA